MGVGPGVVAAEASEVICGTGVACAVALGCSVGAGCDVGPVWSVGAPCAAATNWGVCVACAARALSDVQALPTTAHARLTIKKLRVSILASLIQSPGVV